MVPSQDHQRIVRQTAQVTKRQPHALVLGVAQDGGHPQPGCDHGCCERPGVDHHLTTCVAVVDEGQGWLLDAGPDLRAHLARLSSTGIELAGILLTHGHIGHYTGLMFLGREAMNTEALPVWAAPRLAEFLASNGPWEQLITAGNIELRILEPGVPVSLTHRVSAEAFEVPHRDEYSETVGFLISGPGRSLIYVPDTDSWDEWDPAVEVLIERADIALLDATFFDRAELPGRDISTIAHPLVVESLARFGELNEYDRAKIRFTHLNHSNPLLDPESEEFVRVARAGMAVAKEGEIFEL